MSICCFNINNIDLLSTMIWLSYLNLVAFFQIGPWGRDKNFQVSMLYELWKQNFTSSFFLSHPLLLHIFRKVLVNFLSPLTLCLSGSPGTCYCFRHVRDLLWSCLGYLRDILGTFYLGYIRVYLLMFFLVYVSQSVSMNKNKTWHLLKFFEYFGTILDPLIG